MKIVDDDGNEVPPGVRGEIIQRGPNTMKGYFKQPEATRAALRDGWLYTNDIGYMDEEGYFYIVDRKKDMIIRGGENIYPREVDEVLYQHPKVQDAAVVGVPHEFLGEEVKAFIVLKHGEQATAEEIIAFCQERLADFKCPKTIEFREDLPKTAAGKILKRELQ